LGYSLSLDPPYNFLFLTELVFGWFFGIKLENGLSHDRNRWEKIQKDTKRWEKVGIDSSCIGGRGFSCDVASARAP